jgi:hypothetical protein
LKEAANKVEGTVALECLHRAEESILPLCQSALTIPGLQGMHCYVYDHGIMITGATNGDSDEMLSLHSSCSFQFGARLPQQKEDSEASV